jgi:type IV pilus modification protein PilV
MRQNAGFSLVELMCAILILGVGLVGLTQGITAALRASKESEVQTAAALLAAAQIETLRADGIVFDGTTEGEADEGPYRWRQTVSSTETDGLHEVEVVVEHSQSGQMIYELKTLLFDAPLTTDDTSDPKKNPRKKKEGGRK